MHHPCISAIVLHGKKLGLAFTKGAFSKDSSFHLNQRGAFSLSPYLFTTEAFAFKVGLGNTSLLQFDSSDGKDQPAYKFTKQARMLAVIVDKSNVKLVEYNKDVGEKVENYTESIYPWLDTSYGVVVKRTKDYGGAAKIILGALEAGATTEQIDELVSHYGLFDASSLTWVSFDDIQNTLKAIENRTPDLSAIAAIERFEIRKREAEAVVLPTVTPPKPRRVRNTRGSARSKS